MIDLQPLKIYFIFFKLSVFQIEISGNINKELQLKNKDSILTILLVFQREILGKEINDEQPSNIELISLTFLVLAVQ